jgi:hypothetical protein
MFSRAFCCRGFGQQYRSWKRQEDGRSVDSAELRDGVVKIGVEGAANGPIMDRIESFVLSIS